MVSLALSLHIPQAPCLTLTSYSAQVPIYTTSDVVYESQIEEKQLLRGNLLDKIDSAIFPLHIRDECIAGDGEGCLRMVPSKQGGHDRR